MNDDLKKVSVMFLRSAIDRILAERDIKRKVNFSFAFLLYNYK